MKLGFQHKLLRNTDASNSRCACTKRIQLFSTYFTRLENMTKHPITARDQFFYFIRFYTLHLQRDTLLSCFCLISKYKMTFNALSSPWFSCWSNGHRGLLAIGVKRPGREAEHSPPCSAVVKNAWSNTSTSSYVFMTWWLVKHGANFTFRFTFMV